jgi:RNA polymerase sigma factor (sigma-70 family)
MAIIPLMTVFRRLRRTVLSQEAEGVTDGQLLKRFLEGRDESAFEALVLRHGPMVLGVCRRVLGNADDAEDAFQAVFLVLVRKAGAIARAELLGNWLYGVAYRTALEAKARAARRRAREKQVKDMPHPAVVPAADRAELAALLDQELNRLPDKYRVPVVLCDLEGGSRKDVARQLGLPEGTLSSRLATARQLLAKRLARRGLTVSGGALPAALLENAAAACLPTALVRSTVNAAAGVAAGLAVTTAVVSARVVGLVKGVMRAMALQKIKVMTVVLVALLVAGGGLRTYRAASGTAAAHEGKRGGETPTQGNGKGGATSDDEARAKEAREAAAREAAAREAAAREAAAREAAAKAARAQQTPTVPEPAPAGVGKSVDFAEVSFAIRPSGLAVRQPESIRVVAGGARGEGFCEYRVEGRPGRGREPGWDPAYQRHTFDVKRLRRLEALLKKTDWLTAPGYEGRVVQLHATTYTLTVKRYGKARTITFEGAKDEPYKSLLSFFRDIATQEYLLYRLERLPAREKYDACRQIDYYVRAERGAKYDKPPADLDLRRYVPTCQRYVRHAFQYSTEEVAPAVRLLGYLGSEADREYIAALANDRNLNVRQAVAEALGALGGEKSLPVLRRMVHSTQEAAWQLVRLGPLAVPTVVEVIEGGKDPSNEREPGFLDYQKVIRAYLDHWDRVPRPIDPRVLEAVRKSMAVPKVKAYGTQYHRQLLDLASRPTSRLGDPGAPTSLLALLDPDRSQPAHPRRQRAAHQRAALSRPVDVVEAGQVA